MFSLAKSYRASQVGTKALDKGGAVRIARGPGAQRHPIPLRRIPRWQRRTAGQLPPAQLPPALPAWFPLLAAVNPVHRLVTTIIAVQEEFFWRSPSKDDFRHGAGEWQPCTERVSDICFAPGAFVRWSARGLATPNCAGAILGCDASNALAANLPGEGNISATDNFLRVYRPDSDPTRMVRWKDMTRTVLGALSGQFNVPHNMLSWAVGPFADGLALGQSQIQAQPWAQAVAQAGSQPDWLTHRVDPRKGVQVRPRVQLRIQPGFAFIADGLANSIVLPMTEILIPPIGAVTSKTGPAPSRAGRLAPPRSLGPGRVPPDRVKQQKLTLRTIAPLGMMLLDGVFGAFEFVGILHESVPKAFQAKGHWSGTGSARKWMKPTPYDQAAAVYKYPGKLDLKDVVTGFLNDMLEDFFIANTVALGGKRGAQATGQITGVGRALTGVQRGIDKSGAWIPKIDYEPSTGLYSASWFGHTATARSTSGPR